MSFQHQLHLPNVKSPPRDSLSESSRLPYQSPRVDLLTEFVPRSYIEEREYLRYRDVLSDFISDDDSKGLLIPSCFPHHTYERKLIFRLFEAYERSQKSVVDSRNDMQQLQSKFAESSAKSRFWEKKYVACVNLMQPLKKRLRTMKEQIEETRRNRSLVIQSHQSDVDRWRATESRLQEEVEELTEQLDEVREDVDEAQRTLDTTDDLHSELDRLKVEQAQVEELRERLRVYTGMCDSFENKIKTLENEKADLEEIVARLREAQVKARSDIDAGIATSREKERKLIRTNKALRRIKAGVRQVEDERDALRERLRELYLKKKQRRRERRNHSNSQQRRGPQKDANYASVSISFGSQSSDPSSRSVSARFVPQKRSAAHSHAHAHHPPSQQPVEEALSDDEDGVDADDPIFDLVREDSVVAIDPLLLEDDSFEEDEEGEEREGEGDHPVLSNGLVSLLSQQASGAVPMKHDVGLQVSLPNPNDLVVSVPERPLSVPVDAFVQASPDDPESEVFHLKRQTSELERMVEDLKAKLLLAGGGGNGRNHGSGRGGRSHSHGHHHHHVASRRRTQHGHGRVTGPSSSSTTSAPAFVPSTSIAAAAAASLQQERSGGRVVHFRPSQSVGAKGGGRRSHRMFGGSKRLEELRRDGGRGRTRGGSMPPRPFGLTGSGVRLKRL